jgi:peptidyl-prolyl cis-trans isomerase D
MVKPFEDAVFGGKKGDILGPVKSDFGYHVIQVTDVKDSKVKTLAEATPEIEATLRKQSASRQMAQAAENFSNIVYEQPAGLKPAAAALGLAVRESGWIRKGASADPAFLGNPKVQAEIFSDNSIKANRNTSAIEVAPNDLVAAHVIEHKAAELQPFDSVRADIERRLKREAATKLAAADGAQTLKELQEGRDRGLKWPAPLAVNRQKPGGLPSQVIEAALRPDPKKLPAFVGVDTAIGYSLVRVGKVVEADKPDEAKRKALASRLRDAVAAEEFDAALGSLRERVGVTVRKGAFDKPAATPMQ